MSNMNLSEVLNIAESNSFDNPMTKQELDEVIHTIQINAWNKHGEYPQWAEQHMFTNGQEYNLVSIAIDGDDMRSIDGMVLLVSDNC